MTRSIEQQLGTLALELIACPHCGSAPGVMCVWGSALPMRKLHHARLAPIGHVWRAGWRTGFAAGFDEGGVQAL